MVQHVGRVLEGKKKNIVIQHVGRVLEGHARYFVVALFLALSEAREAVEDRISGIRRPRNGVVVEGAVVVLVGRSSRAVPLGRERPVHPVVGLD